MAKRRSNRMALHASVGLSGEDRQKCSFTIPAAKATKLNKHGAAVQLSRELLVGSVVSVNNKQGARLSARVVAQLAASEGVLTYAIEFVEQDERAETFWGIMFPPNTSNA
ncbi:MAG: PilZ domain-containing protein [Candidatus Sulfotelmatobacter sp.]